MIDLVANKNEYLRLARTYIKREGVEKLLAWLERSDFFVAPASTQYNLPVEGGLCQSTLNIADAMIRYFYGHGLESITEEDVTKTFENDMTLESILLVSLFAPIHKAYCYAKDFKNVKVNGKWEQQEYWKWDEKFTWHGRGGKSVFIIQQYMRLYVEEAQAIAFYMAGEDNVFSDIVDTTYKRVYENSRLAVYLHLAYMESIYVKDMRSLS